MKSVKVLFVCLGNICRSVLAEAIFSDKIKKMGLDKLVEVDSCGTSNYHIGDLADARTRANAKKNNIKIDHYGRQLSQNDLVYFDYIVAMDKSNYDDILKLDIAFEHRHKVKLMRTFDPLKDSEEVPDPYYGGEDGFQEVFEILNRSISSFIEYLEREYFKA